MSIQSKLIALIMAFSSLSAFSYEGLENQKSNQELSNALQQLVETNNLIGTHFVAVVDENGLVSFDKFSAEQRNFNQNSQFLIASHTKALTSTLAAILHANNEIDLYKPMSEYESKILTNEKVNTEDITLHKLLTHSGGFTSIQHSFKTAYLGYEDNDELVDSLNAKTLVALDYKFRYSNTGPIVAANIIENELGKSWQELLKERVYASLGMENTMSVISDGVIPSIITSKDNTAFTQGHFKTNKTMHASGGIASTAADLTRWLQANISKENDTLNAENIFEIMHTQQVEQNRTYFTYDRVGYTLGWDVATYNDELLLTRFGTYAGYSVHISFMPEKKLGVIAFTNQDIAFALPHVIANYAYNLKLGKENTNEAFVEESERLKQSIDKQKEAAPSFTQIVASDAISAQMFGEYENNEGWPTMSFSNENEVVAVSWGVLSGVLLKEGDEYIAHFGALTRPIKMPESEEEKDKFYNGSILFEKSE